MRKFNLELNEKVISKLNSINEFDNEELLKDFSFDKVTTDEVNKVINISRDIMNVFQNNNMNMEDSYMMLLSLADAIYISSLVDNASD